MKVDLVTITYNTWNTYTERMIRMVERFTNPALVNQWIICDNNSDDGWRLAFYKHNWKLPTLKVFERENIGDLPRYNTLFTEVCTADIIVAISTDVRIFDDDWLEKFISPFLQDETIGMVGCSGPGIGMTPEHANPTIGGTWHWIPQLLTDRGVLDFDDCQHVQTHLFAVRRKAFLEVGGFWVPEADLLNKGHLIAGEVMMGPRMRKAGWKLCFNPPRNYHYGSGAKNSTNHLMARTLLDLYDKGHGWVVDF